MKPEVTLVYNKAGEQKSVLLETNSEVRCDGDGRGGRKSGSGT